MADAGGHLDSTRRAPRYPLDVRLQVRVQAEHDPVVAGRTFDVSEGGLGAWLVRELPVGQEVQLEFIVPGMDTPLRLPAVVRYSAGQHCGFSFGELRPGERAILRRYCEGWTKLS